MSELGHGGKEVKSLREILHEKLEALRDNHSDEIPEEIIHRHTHPEVKTKALKSWWTSLVGFLDLAEGEIKDRKAKEDLKVFVEHYASKEFHTQQRVLPNDIAKANSITNLVIDQLKSA